MSTGKKHILFLSAHLNENAEIQATIETCICLFVYNYCGLEGNICFVDDQEDYPCELSKNCVKNIQYDCATPNEIEAQGVCLLFPAIKTDSGRFFIGGVCAVLRWVIKLHLLQHPGHFSEALLGFRGGCLVSCTESSVWTKFCELDMPNAVSKCIKPEIKSTEIPSCLVLLESHLMRPVRTHNILKRKLDAVKRVRKLKVISLSNPKLDNDAVEHGKIEFTIFDQNSVPLNSEDISKTLKDIVITEKSEEFSLLHNYLEGIDLTLADMIVFPCVYHLLKELPSSSSFHLTHVLQWYKRLLTDVHIEIAAAACGFIIDSIFNVDNKASLDSITVPEVDRNSLYKRDPSHTKMKIKQKSSSGVVKLLREAGIHSDYSTGFCTKLNWKTLPQALHPANGDLPQKRVERKCQQVESMVSAVLKVAQGGQTIVEFCAGGGHVGLLIAYLLPKCKIILIENKESSILRAKTRAEELDLGNIYFYQCNLDYFRGSFNIGLSLHACGVATDLVVQRCLQQGSSFVCCPCCYGGIRDTHLLTYPLSKRFRNSPITYKHYTLLARCADRTEVDTLTAQEGEVCMGLIDTDRILWAQEQGYDAKLTTLSPLTCSTKHNLLIGRSPKWKHS